MSLKKNKDGVKGLQLSPESKAAVNSVYSGIDTVLNILRNAEMFGGELNLDVNVNPFEYILNVLQRVKGFEWVYKVIGNVLTIGLVPMEEAIKVALLANIKNLLSCSLDFFITDKLLEEGIVLDMGSLDVLRLLSKCPVQTDFSTNTNDFGHYFYHDCENMTSPVDLKRSKDFNALLWYMKNSSKGERVVWRGNALQHEDLRPSLLCEQEKEDGIVTLQYHGTTGVVSKANGTTQYLQSPCMNCMHVFLGNTRPLDDNPEFLDTMISENQRILDDFDRIVKETDDIIEDLNIKKNNADGDVAMTAMYEVYVECIETLMEIRAKIDDRGTSLTISELLPQNLDPQSTITITHVPGTGEILITVIPSGKTILISERMAASCHRNVIGNVEMLNKMKSGYSMSHYSYRPAYYNYYHNKTLMEFNFDYIYSMKLFDGKVVAAQLINAMTSCLSIGVSLSYEEQIVMEYVMGMVRDVVERDDTIVNDCFFTFTNDQYNDMVERTTLNRLGIGNDINTGFPSANPALILEQLNTINSLSTKKELSTAIERVLATSCGTEYGTTTGGDGFTASTNINNLLDNILNNLAYVIVCSVISPKLYMMMAINLKLLGQNPNFNIIEFLNCFKQMIISLIKTVKDQLLKILMQELMKLITELTEEVASVIAKEQLNYLMRFVKDCVACFNMSRGALKDWSPDEVDYADINTDDIETEQITEQTNC